MIPATKHCAIYTRKSSDERLELEFNSLDAQRESCEAYIISQKSEGWQTVKHKYDDGGFSGGTMERPALRQLLSDIKSGKVHIVVVYKIDRLTRSLMDFAKLVETFDAHGVTFVSVTQSFNTTTSMGRLTLNVLLSFAQFEREVAGERIRDKIAASKKRGMWMGGSMPLGYDVVKKQLIINATEAEIVRYIFTRYLKLGNVTELRAELAEKGIKSKIKISEKRRKYGGVTYSRGAIYSILRNPLYIGQVRHKQETYIGQHKAIIDMDLWGAVQKKLQNGATTARGIRQSRNINLLQGLLCDCEGTLYSPSHTNKNGRRYRYYLSQNLLQYRNHPKGTMARLPAHEIETAVAKALENEIKAPETLAKLLHVDIEYHHREICYIADQDWSSQMCDIVRSTIAKVIVGTDSLTLQVNSNLLKEEICKNLRLSLPRSQKSLSKEIIVPFKISRAEKGAIIISAKKCNRDALDLPPHELKKLVQGIIWRDEHFNGKTLREIAGKNDLSEGYIGRCIFNTFKILGKKFNAIS